MFLQRSLPHLTPDCGSKYSRSCTLCSHTHTHTRRQTSKTFPQPCVVSLILLPVDQSLACGQMADGSQSGEGREPDFPLMSEIVCGSKRSAQESLQSCTGWRVFIANFGPFGCCRTVAASSGFWRLFTFNELEMWWKGWFMSGNRTPGVGCSSAPRRSADQQPQRWEVKLEPRTVACRRTMTVQWSFWLMTVSLAALIVFAK